MNKERILIVHNYYQVPGGEDTVVANEKKMLEDNGHNVILYSRNNLELKKFNLVKKLIFPLTTIFSLKTYKEVRKIIKKYNIDIVHVHNTLSLVSPSVYYAAFSCKVPVVQTIHNFRLICPGATFYRNENICEDCVKKGLTCALRNKCYRSRFVHTLASVITLKIHRILGTYKKLNYICLTEFNKQKLLELNLGKKIINSNKIFVKPNFVNIKKEFIPYENRKNQFIFVGRLDKLKGIRLLLEAWSGIDHYNAVNGPNLIICGTGPEEKWCKNYIKENNLSNIQMMGFISNTKALDLISESKALILPTQWYEGFPMTIVESYSCGTPVIGSNIGNVDILIKDGVTGFKFEFNSVESLREAINNLGDMTQGSRKMFLDNYMPNINYEQLNKIYKCCKDRFN